MSGSSSRSISRTCPCRQAPLSHRLHLSDEEDIVQDLCKLLQDVEDLRKITEMPMKCFQMSFKFFQYVHLSNDLHLFATFPLSFTDRPPASGFHYRLRPAR